MKAFFPVLLLLLSWPIHSPSGKGHIIGTVSDSTDGKPLIGAAILVRGTDFGAATDTSGFFAIRDIPAGKYRLMVSYIGFQPINIDSVQVKPDSTLRIDVSLKPSVGSNGPIEVTVPNLKFKTLYYQPDSSVDFKIRIYAPNQMKSATIDSAKSGRQR